MNVKASYLTAVAATILTIAGCGTATAPAGHIANSVPAASAGNSPASAGSPAPMASASSSIIANVEMTDAESRLATAS